MDNIVTFNEIDQLLKAGRETDAITVATSFIAEDSENFYGYYLLGWIHRCSSRFGLAIEAYLKAASLAEDENVLLGLGIAQQLDAQYSAAIDTLKNAIRLNPDFHLAYNSLGLTYKKSGDFYRAIQAYEGAQECLVNHASVEAIRLDPSLDNEVVDKTAIMNPRVFEAARMILKSSPEYSITLNNLGVCLAEMRDFEAAKDAYRESIEFIPDGYDYPYPNLNLAELERLG